MSSYIPIEIVSKILCELDIQTIVRCRCVSKEWRSLIDSNGFICTHLNHSITTNTNNTLFLLGPEGSLYSVNFDTLYPSDPITLQDQPLVPPQRHGVRFIDSCNGLLCLCNEDEDFLILNPSLQKYYQIPSPLRMVSEEDNDFGRGYGFGYDAVSEDYKLVKILQGPGLTYGESEMGIKSLMKKDSYKIIPMPYVLLTNHSYGVHVGGVLHWFVGRGPDKIVGFDLGVYEFREVAQPDCGANVDERSLFVFDGCLCVVAGFRGVRCDVWVMKKYGVEESWCKVFSVSCSVFGYYLKPLRYSRKGGEVLLQVSGGKLVWYDIEKKRALDVVIKGRENYFTATVCLSSLVPPKPEQSPEKKKITMWKNWKRYISRLDPI